MRSAVVALLMSGLVVTAVSADEAQTRRSVPYGEARDTFRRLGYHPYLMPGAEICDPDDPRCFPELESCAKSRTWACTYTWRRGKTIIEVETRYDNPVVARTDCIVSCRAAGTASAEPPPHPAGDPDRVD